jgi:16S rRNA processing protein RimM
VAGEGPVQAGRVQVGRIVAPHGVKGAVRIEPATDFPGRFAPGRRLVVEGAARLITHCSWHKGQARVTLEGVDTIDKAEALKWVPVFAPEGEPPPLGPDEFLESDVVGLVAVDEKGRRIGTVEAIERAPAHDLIVVDGARVPALREFVKEIDIEAGRIVLRLIPGMAPGEEAEEVR